MKVSVLGFPATLLGLLGLAILGGCQNQTSPFLGKWYLLERPSMLEIRKGDKGLEWIDAQSSNPLEERDGSLYIPGLGNAVQLTIENNSTDGKTLARRFLTMGGDTKTETYTQNLDAVKPRYIEQANAYIKKILDLSAYEAIERIGFNEDCKRVGSIFDDRDKEVRDYLASDAVFSCTATSGDTYGNSIGVTLKVNLIDEPITAFSSEKSDVGVALGQWSEVEYSFSPENVTFVKQTDGKLEGSLNGMTFKNCDFKNRYLLECDKPSEDYGQEKFKVIVFPELDKMYLELNERDVNGAYTRALKRS